MGLFVYIQGAYSFQDCHRKNMAQLIYAIFYGQIYLDIYKHCNFSRYIDLEV